MNKEIENQSTSKRDLVVTFITNHPKAVLLLWTARKRALEIGGKWLVVYIETPQQQNTIYNVRQEQILQLLTRAKQMGAETEHIETLDALQGAEALLAREAPRIVEVIVGSVETEGGWLRRLRTPEWVRLIHLASHYAKVQTVPLTGQFKQTFFQKLVHRLRTIEPVNIGYALLGLLVPFALAFILQSSLPAAFFRINEQNVDNLFLITIAIIAGRYGLAPGLVAAMTGFLMCNYFFTVPYHTLQLQSMTDLFGMALFLSAAVLIAVFTSQMRGHAEKIKKRELHTEMLFTLYRLSSESYTKKQAIDKLQSTLEKMLKAEVAFFMPPENNTANLELVSPVDVVLEENDRKALEVCWSEMKCTGAASPYNPGTQWRFEPMIAAGGEIGVLGVRMPKRNQLDAWFGRLLVAMADQTAAILAHIDLKRSMEDTRISEEREKLRVMLLSSVSHDLKTPLAGIIGALSAYHTLSHRLTPEQQKELITGSLEEAQRLDSFISNILDMTQLEAGNIKFRSEWHNINGMTEEVVKRLSHRLKKRKLSVHFPTTDIEIKIDYTMTSQVLQNLLDNACKYTPDDATITLSWDVDKSHGVICSIHDNGRGIPVDQLKSIFDKYTRLHKQDMKTPGTGLGLAIAKAIVEAQGGWIHAENHPDGGAVFTFLLPHWRVVNSTIRQEKHYAAH